MERYDYTADVNYPGSQIRSTYERRPVAPEFDQHPVGVSLLMGLAGFVGAGCFVMFVGWPLRFLWLAGLIGAALFLIAVIWLIDVQNQRTLMERETVLSLPDDELRPVVTDGRRGETIRRGNFTMSRKYWTRLYDLAADGRRLTRDDVVKADAMPREWYHGDFNGVTAELRRVGLLDAENRMTDDWRSFHREVVAPSPVQAFVRSSNANEAQGAGGVGG